MIIDGLQINDWSRDVIEEVRSGGVDVVHATVGVWEDMAGAMTRIGAFRHLCRHNSDLIRVSPGRLRRSTKRKPTTYLRSSSAFRTVRCWATTLRWLESSPTSAFG
ncbi:MAG: hypothetical protein CM1200mP26_20750 [Acidimicrobiales bacterium]|nr:MAG: hypothetical protein CM1200mP26_20750 [Acidimicrobiales bacterium]